MRQEGLDPEGKVELAGLLLQIGFKSEAVTEYLMAAQMYEERGDKEEAVKLYEKILELDNDNQAAKRGLEKLKPRSRENIDEMVARMGFGPVPGEEPAPEEPSTQEITTPEETETPPPSAPEGEQKVQSTSEPPEGTPTTEVSEVQVEPQPPAEEAEPEVEEGGIDLASIGIEEFLASLMPLLKHTPAELKKRRELASFFREEGLWSEAFFEKRSDYLQKPSVKKLNDLLSLLADSGDKETLIGFLLTESFTEREVELKREVLKALAVAYEEQGHLQDAKKIREKLATLALQTQKQKKKKPGVKIIEDVPRLSEEDTPKGKKKPADPIQFV